MAASLLPNGATINSKKGLSQRTDGTVWSGPFLERMRAHYSNVELIILDDNPIYMIAAAMLYLITQIFGLVAPCRELPFGDFFIIMGGDLGQLAPVKGVSLASLINAPGRNGLLSSELRGRLADFGMSRESAVDSAYYTRSGACAVSSIFLVGVMC